MRDHQQGVLTSPGQNPEGSPFPDPRPSSLQDALERAASTLPPPSSAANVSTTSAGSAPSTRVAVPVPEPLQALIESKDPQSGLTLGEMHARLEEEPEDYAWSYQMEEYLRRHLAQPPDRAMFEVVLIECRTTWCEIQAFAHGPNGPGAFASALQSMTQQPWWDFAHAYSSSASHADGGKLLAILQRRR